MFTREEIGLIRATVERVAGMDMSITNVFYSELFRHDQSLRGLFPEDMFSQSEKLWKAMVFVIEALETPDILRTTLAEMGRRHRGYGADVASYDLVNTVLIKTLANMMGDDWSTAYQAAWSKALHFVSNSMIAGANADAA